MPPVTGSLPAAAGRWPPRDGSVSLRTLRGRVSGVRRFPVWSTTRAVADLMVEAADDYSRGRVRVRALRHEADAAISCPDAQPPAPHRHRLRATAGGGQSLFEPLERGGRRGRAPSPVGPSPGPRRARVLRTRVSRLGLGRSASASSRSSCEPPCPRVAARSRSTARGPGGSPPTSTRPSAGATFALDVNPLPFLVPATARGRTAEPPRVPRRSERRGRGRGSTSSRARSPCGTDFHSSSRTLCGRRSPRGLDAVVTSWFIDVTRTDIRHTAAAINRVLRPGGLWVNLGPLRFHSELRVRTRSRRRWRSSAQRFELVSHDRQELPYFDSPASGSRRTDLCSGSRRARPARRPPSNPGPFAPWVTTPCSRSPSRRRWWSWATRRCSRTACFRSSTATVRSWRSHRSWGRRGASIRGAWRTSCGCSSPTAAR